MIGRTTDAGTRLRAEILRDRASTPQVVDGGGRAPVDADARDAWASHPAARRGPMRRLGTMPSQADLEWPGDDAHVHAHAPAGRGDVNVSVHNDAQHYRPWKEELRLSAAKAAGNAAAWPFRLVQRVVERIVDGIAGLFGFVVKLLVIPVLLVVAISVYHTAQNRPASETAHEVGRQSVGIVGGLVHGIWEGLFGKSAPTAPAPGAQRAGDAPRAGDGADAPATSGRSRS